MEVYLIRHTTPKIEKGICYGQSDIPLAASFQAEAKKILKNLPATVDAVYSSPSPRCQQLADFFSFATCCIDNRLLEFDFGEWEMKKWNDIDNATLNAWMGDFVTMRVPQGENFLELYSRVKDFIIELAKTQHKKVAIVTHGGVIRCFVAYVLETPLKDAFATPIDYSSVTKIILNSNTVENKLAYLNKH